MYGPPRTNFHVHLFPYEEQGNLYNMINWTVPATFGLCGNNAAGDKIVIPSMLCPSDGLGGPTIVTGCLGRTMWARLELLRRLQRHADRRLLLSRRPHANGPFSTPTAHHHRPDSRRHQQHDVHCRKPHRPGRLLPRVSLERPALRGVRVHRIGRPTARCPTDAIPMP